jgi:cytochrome P450
MEQAPMGQALAGFSYPSAEVVECPYAFYDALRRETPVHRLDNGDFLVSRWEDVVAVTQRPVLFSSAIIRYNHGALGEGGPRDVYEPSAVIFSDPPEHKVKRAFCLPLRSSERLREIEEIAQRHVNGLIDEFVDRGEVEFKSAFADRLPLLVMMELLGLPLEDEVLWKRPRGADSDEVMFDGESTRFSRPEARPALAEAARAYRETWRALVRDRQQHPRENDFLTDMIRAQIERDGRPDVGYLAAEAGNILSAGNVTTADMLASTMVLLLSTPGLYERVRGDGGLIPQLIEESVRVESPVQWTQRVATADAEIAGVAIPEGSVVMLAWASANRDPEKFEQPEDVRLGRPRVMRDHLGFGTGLHHCVGAPIARLEGRVAFTTLLTRLTGLRLSDDNDPRHILNPVFRAPRTVRIEFERGKPGCRPPPQAACRGGHPPARCPP